MSAAVIKYPDRSQFKEEKVSSAYSPRLHPTTAGESGKELEVSGHTHSQEQSQWMYACLFLSYTDQDSNPGSGAAHFGLGLPISKNRIKTILRDMSTAHLMQTVPHCNSPADKQSSQ